MKVWQNKKICQFLKNKHEMDRNYCRTEMNVRHSRINSHKKTTPSITWINALSRRSIGRALQREKM